MIFCLKNKESDWPATLANNIAEDQLVQVQLQKKIVFVRSEAVILEVLKTCVCLAIFTGSSCLFLWNLHSQGSPAVVPA